MTQIIRYMIRIVCMYAFLLLSVVQGNGSFFRLMREGRGEIITFGDSLTHGMVVTVDPESWRRDNHPFSIKLAQLTNLTVVEKGFNGMKAKEMKPHLELVLSEAKASKRNVKVVTILGGTNDLASHELEADINRYIEDLHKCALAHNENLVTVALTIPDLSWKEVDHIARHKINNHLRKFSASNRRIILVDLEKLFKLKTVESKALYSIDDVHLSPLGYDTVAAMIFDALLKYE